MNKTEQELLLHNIKCNPEDDTVRLVYADWLTEHGEEEHGTFIRVQCELARRHGDGWDDARREIRQQQLIGRLSDAAAAMLLATADVVPDPLHGRERELFAKYCRSWFPNPSAGEWRWHCGEWEEGLTGPGWVVRRGFPDKVRAPLVSLVGGPCGRCEGRGVIYPHMVPRNLAEACPMCGNPEKGERGTGTLPGVLPALVREHPLTTATATCRVPGESMHGVWYWEERGFMDGSAERWVLPGEVFDHLADYDYESRRTDRHPSRQRNYQSAAAAHAALSEALLKWGRTFTP
jgi:uncharacterized protein (TIGR02996 family)